MADFELTPQTMVGDVVAAHPATVPMFEALGIDYCCGGQHTLQEAANAAKLPVERVIAVVTTTIQQEAKPVETERDWQHEPLGALMTHILQIHHEYMHRELPRLADMLEKVKRAHATSHGDIINPLADTFTNLRTELDEHLKKEEAITFPAIARLAAGTCDEDAIRTVDELEHEHQEAGKALEAMRV
ncbi:MAG TPA: DUF542 domain-containing protein, partial [Armatimonadota bacterium]|nr:DUF542 domain-containing protein [Armatimonadota bacterium]